MADDSSFSAADDGVWAALQDTTSAAGAALRAWRAEQWSQGHWGKDFSDTADFIPAPEEIKDTDSPALVVVTAGASTLEDVAADYRSLAYPVSVMGFLRSKRREKDTLKKLKRFGELTWNLLVDHSRTCFDVSTVSRVRMQGLEWPDLQRDDLFVFTIGLQLEVVLST